MPESDAGWGRCWAALLWGDLCHTFLLNLCLRFFAFSQLPSLERQERMVWGVSWMDGRHCLSYPISQPSTCHPTQLATRKARNYRWHMLEIQPGSILMESTTLNVFLTANPTGCLSALWLPCVIIQISVFFGSPAFCCFLSASVCLCLS